MSSNGSSQQSSPVPHPSPSPSFVYPIKSLLPIGIQSEESEAKRTIPTKGQTASPDNTSADLRVADRHTALATGLRSSTATLSASALPAGRAEGRTNIKDNKNTREMPPRRQKTDIALRPRLLTRSLSATASAPVLSSGFGHFLQEQGFTNEQTVLETGSRPESSNSAYPPGLSPAALSLDSLRSGTTPPIDQPMDGDQALPYSPAEYGVVHLLPLPLTLDPGIHESEQLDTTSEASDSSSSLDAWEAAHSLSTCINSSRDIEEDSPLITVRYTHTQDEHGNHVVLGREGKFQRCADEPIRSPGAVQGFGVLLVVDEKEDALPVRQVSENAQEILGLSPSYLFSLECLTDVLSESQASLLWDNIQCLPEQGSISADEMANDTPHVFLLTGWGEPGSAIVGQPSGDFDRRKWTCWCAIHRPPSQDKDSGKSLIIVELELQVDHLNPLYPPSIENEDVNDTTGRSTNMPAPYTLVTDSPSAPTSTKFPVLVRSGTPSASSPEASSPAFQDIIGSTTTYSKPLAALERFRKMAKLREQHHSEGTSRRRKGGQSSHGVDTMQVLAVMAQINEQFADAQDLDSLLKVIAGITKDLTQFHRIMVYQFDEGWNGQVVAELVDWSKTQELYKGLHFPAGDIPAQARALYVINQVRLLYDRSLPTARLVVKTEEDLAPPLDMTHSYLRAMSPIHIKYLENMGVQASMSVSIVAFGSLWGLISCHSYRSTGMRVPFPVRQMLRLVSQSASRNVERLTYSQRLHSRKLVNSMLSDQHPTGYIVSDGDELLGLFDADFGILVVGEGAKILGTDEHGQELLLVAEYLRFKKYRTIRVSQSLTDDFPDLTFSSGKDVVAGLLYVPLSKSGMDFIAFLRKGQLRNVHWGGKPQKETKGVLEPRKSFKIWSETVAGRCRVWTEDQLETAGVLALVYGKFIEVWREKETALRATKLTNILLTNASHEVRTPLNHIINCLELALNGPLDEETRNNLLRSHASSKSLLFTINDLLDLTRVETGHELSSTDPFDLHHAINRSAKLYKREAERRRIQFNVNLDGSPQIVVGDGMKIRTMVQNLAANALKYTKEGTIDISCLEYEEPKGLRRPDEVVVEIVVADTGSGMPPEQLEKIFREFEQVESVPRNKPNSNAETGIGLGLAIVSRIIGQLGGQLRVESQVGQGSKFSCLIPLLLPRAGDHPLSTSPTSDTFGLTPIRSRSASASSRRGAIDHFVEALSSHNLNTRNRSQQSFHEPESSAAPSTQQAASVTYQQRPARRRSSRQRKGEADTGSTGALRILVVEDNDINRAILSKRLKISGHTVVGTTNGQEALDRITSDRAFDAILMDIQMPILNGFEASQKIREVEEASLLEPGSRPSHDAHGRIPIFAVSASLRENQKDELMSYGMDGWLLKPIHFQRLTDILRGVTDLEEMQKCMYKPGCDWELGGWFACLPGL